MSILDAYGYHYEIIGKLSDKYVIIKSEKYGLWLVSTRGAYIKNVFEIINSSNTETKLRSILSLNTSKIKIKPFKYTCKNQIENDLNEVLINTSNKKFDDMFVITNGKYSIMLLSYGSHRSEISKRNPSYRNFSPSSTMDSFLSRALVNFSRVKPGDIFLDPFAGSGSITIEAASLGCYTIAVDKSFKQIFGLETNKISFGFEVDTIIGDATNLPIRDKVIDGIATDPPYGRSAGTFKRKIIDVYKGFFKEARRVLKPKKFMVFCAPNSIKSNLEKLLTDNNFIIDRKFEMRVHKNLTRLIYATKLL